MRLSDAPVLQGRLYEGEAGTWDNRKTFSSTFDFTLTDQKKSSSLSVLARQKLVIRRWGNILRINILSFTSCCNETITDNQSRGGVSDQFIVPVCISYRLGPHTPLYTHNIQSANSPASQQFFLTLGYFPSGSQLLHLHRLCCWMPGMTGLVSEAA